MDSLVAEVDGALGAIIVDYDGESVITSCGEFPMHDLKVIVVSVPIADSTSRLVQLVKSLATGNTLAA